MHLIRPSRPDADALRLAERQFGAATHMVLVDDRGPAVSFMGWKLGAAFVECSEDTGSTRTVTVEVLYSETTAYGVAERSETRLADGATRLDASVTLFNSTRDIRRHCESWTGDAVRDMARAAALDHAVRAWPGLRAGRITHESRPPARISASISPLR